MEFTLFGVALAVIVISLVKAIQGETGITDRYANYLRAGLMGLAYLLYTFGPELATMYPWFERTVVVGGGFIAVVLSMMGYWPEVQKVGNRIKGV